MILPPNSQDCTQTS